MYQLLHVGLGPLGQRIVADLQRRGLGRVVAAVDPAPALVNRDLAELVPGLANALPGGTRPRIRSSLEEVNEWASIRCAVVTTRSDLELCMDTFRALLTRGCSVVSTCEELAWPWLRHPVLAQELHELAVRGGARIVGTGINPGFLMDALPVAATSACHSVHSVRVERIQDAGKRRLPFQQKVGIGLPLAEFERRVAAGTLRHVGLGESLHFLAHFLGWRIERWEETIVPVVAERELESGLGPVPAGSARGVHQEARAWVGGRLALELIFQAALGEAEPRDRAVIEGEPPVELLVPGGVHGDTATSALVLNVIRPLLAAEPGLHTMASLPLQGCVSPGSV
jgi:4-hydroxy-tetrahydrodipicolinate reductase